MFRVLCVFKRRIFFFLESLANISVVFLQINITFIRFQNVFFIANKYLDILQ